MDDDKKEKIPALVFKALDRSGFPFQTAVHHVVQNLVPASLENKWYVSESEFPWRDASGKDEFLDLVIRRKNWFVAVECKKTEKENYIFLQPLGVTHTGANHERVRCLRGGSNFRLLCEDWSIRPPSSECEFCVVTTSESGNEQRPLERDASLLVRATGALAFHQEKRFEVNADPVPQEDRLYFSIIVTNAPLYTAWYNPDTIDLKSAKFVNNAEAKRVSWVRLRKALTSPVGIYLDIRTVFVVSADELHRFLSLFEKSPSDNAKDRNGLPFHRPK